MKKLTFKQKLYNFWHNEKFRKVRDITLFVSLGFNLLIFILFGVVSCSIKESETSNDHTNQPQNQLVQTRKELNGFNIYSNQSCIGFDLHNLIVNDVQWDYSPDTNYVDLYNINGYAMLQKTGGSNVLQNINQLAIDIASDHLYMRINGADSFQCAWVKSPTTKVWAVSFNGMANKLFINYNQSDEYNYWFSILSQFFGVVNYKEYDLANNWNPYSYFGASDGIIRNYSGTQAIKISILDNSAFSIKGKFYNQFNIWLFSLQASGVIDSTGSRYTYTGEDFYIGMVEARNTLTNESLNIISASYETRYNSDNNSSGLYLLLNSYTISDYDNLKIKLFDYNLQGATSLTQYTNGNALEVQSNYSATSGTGGDIGNAITLLGGAFTGLKNIFTISVLPGITLGLLLFLPVIVSIIVLIFKAVKK